MGIPPPGPGPFPLTLDTASFYLLAGTLCLFVLMMFLLLRYYPRSKRAFEGYAEAAGVSIVFLVFAVVMVVALVASDPSGNRTSYALYRTILSGYWLAFAIPVVTVGSSVQARSRGRIGWLLPSVAAAVLMFFAILVAYYSGAY